MCEALVEEWRDIVFYQGRYQISNKGRVRSMKREYCCMMKGHNVCQTFPERIMKTLFEKDYEIVWLNFDGDKKKHRVHRLVACAFLKNPSGKDFVNHKNKDRKHNCINNLEWMTHEENMHHRDNYVARDEPF